MKRFLRRFGWLFVLLLIAGCEQKAVDSRSRLASEPLPEKTDSVTDKPVLPSLDRKIIKEGEIHFETSDLDETRQRITASVTSLEGYISKENQYTYNDRISQTLEIRVPSGNFDKLIEDISKGVERFDMKRVQATDVTEEYLDIELRMRIKKETENRYRELLAKAQTVEEILSIEKQIGELRAEIESIEGRLKYLKDQISYSTLTVTFYEMVSTPVSFTSKLGVGLKNGWNNFIWFLIGLVNVWPFILLGSFGVLGIIAYRKRRKAGKRHSKTDKND